MSRTPRAVAAGLLAALALAGCGGDPEPEIADPSPSPSPTAETSEPEEPRPPELPAEASVDDQEGAKVFALHWWDVANYAQATGRTKALARISSPQCEACQGAIDFVDQIYRRGGEVRGGENSVRVTDISPAYAGRERLFDIAFVNKNTAQHISYPKSKDDRFEADKTTGRFIVSWFNGHWRVDLWEIG